MNKYDLSNFRVIRRSGQSVGFDASKIRNAIANAFLKDAEGQPRRRGSLALSASEHEKIDRFTEQAVIAVTGHKTAGAAIGIEEIQDQVELALMRAGEHEVARDYVMFRARRAEQRNAAQAVEHPAEQSIAMIDGDERQLIDCHFITGLVMEACEGIPEANLEPIIEQVMRDIYDGIPREKVDEAVLLASRSLIELDPAYGLVTAQIFLRMVRREVLGVAVSPAEMSMLYPIQLIDMVEQGIEAGRLDPRLQTQFDLSRLGAALRPERDMQFRYIGLQTLYDRYFIHVEDRRIELPQTFFGSTRLCVEL